MPRYERSYTGEKRTDGLRLMLTPTERRELEEAAEGQGAPNLSTYARELLFRRSAAVVAATRRNPEAKAIMDALDTAAGELNAIGVNLNQIARHLNSTGDLRDWGELREALDLYRDGAERYIGAVERVLAL
jgi:hypothetical protein